MNLGDFIITESKMIFPLINIFYKNWKVSLCKEYNY